MLKWVTVALVIVLCIAAPVAAQDRQKPEGTWAVKVDFGGGAILISYLQNFTADGRMTLILPWGPGSNEGDTRTGCMGEWRMRPGRHAKDYDFTMRCLYDQTWDSTYGEIRGILALNPAGDKWEAVFTYYDWTGGVQGWGGQGVMTAERIVIKPLR